MERFTCKRDKTTGDAEVTDGLAKAAYARAFGPGGAKMMTRVHPDIMRAAAEKLNKLTIERRDTRHLDYGTALSQIAMEQRPLLFLSQAQVAESNATADIALVEDDAR